MQHDDKTRGLTRRTSQLVKVVTEPTLNLHTGFNSPTFSSAFNCYTVLANNNAFTVCMHD